MFNTVRFSTAARKGGIIALVAALVVALSATFEVEAAEAGNWAVASAQGAITINGQPADSSIATVGPGAVIETGADGNVVLTRPGDSITVFPNSKMSVPVTDSGREPGILQTFGKLLFRMESRESRDFEVKTPYLAAAIKGTTFTVEVDDEDSVIEVEEGSVLVTASRSGQSAFLSSGERARVGRASGDSVQASGRSSDDNGGNGANRSSNNDDRKGKKDKKDKKDKKPK